MLPNPQLFWAARLRKRRAGSHLVRASADLCAAGRPAKRTNGAAPAVMNGTRSMPEACVPPAFTRGLRPSAFGEPMVAVHSVKPGVTVFPTEADSVGLESETIRHMSETSISAAAPHRKEPSPIADDMLTICAISIVAGILTNILHEGVGHGLVALLTGAKSGVLTTVAWSSASDSRLVEAGGTLVNLAAALVFWVALRTAKQASISVRYFLLIGCAFNLFTGTGYFFFSGVTNFGDWAAVISGLHPHWLWRVLLVMVGASSYFAAVLVVGIGLVRYVGIPRHEQGRLRKLTVVPYLSAILLASLAGLLNPLGIQLLWQSALPATAGGLSGLVWLQYYIPRQTEPKRSPGQLAWSYVWIGVAAVMGVAYVVVLGRGVTLRS